MPTLRFQAKNICQWLNELQYEVDHIQNIFKGEFPTEVALNSVYPTGQISWFAFVDSTDSFWYWSKVLGIWVNQNISEVDYLALPVSARNCVPYLII